MAKRKQPAPFRYVPSHSTDLRRGRFAALIKRNEKARKARREQEQRA
jgi:hypothetical protein